MTENQKDWMSELWNTELYQEFKQENFKILDDFLTTPPKNILDIGCGLAWESRLFNQKYGSELWLLDGDYKDNSNKPEYSSQASWHHTADDFMYYYPLQKLKEELDRLETKNYNLIDCNRINLPSDLKFDLITSWISCGFHYPSSTYRDLILKHSHPDTKIIFDIRIKRKQTNPILESGVEIVHILNERSKYVTSEIKFV